MIRLWGLALLALALGLSACASLYRPSPGHLAEQAWSLRRAELVALDHWLLQARIASGRVGLSGNLRWQQRAGDFDIRVSGPLGSGGLQARGHLGEVEIRTARETLVTYEPERLLQEKLGWSLPLTHMRYWAVGAPYPGTPAQVEYDAGGRLTRLQQDGWVIEYGEYTRHERHDLPRRLTLDNGDAHFRLVVDAWSEVG